MALAPVTAGTTDPEARTPFLRAPRRTPRRSWVTTARRMLRAGPDVAEDHPQCSSVSAQCQRADARHSTVPPSLSPRQRRRAIVSVTVLLPRSPHAVARRPSAAADTSRSSCRRTATCPRRSRRPSRARRPTRTASRPTAHGPRRRPRAVASGCTTRQVRGDADLATDHVHAGASQGGAIGHRRPAMTSWSRRGRRRTSSRRGEGARRRRAVGVSPATPALGRSPGSSRDRRSVPGCP